MIDEGDSIANIVGRFNIKGVRTLTVITKNGLEKSFKPVGEIRSFEVERP